MANKRIVATRTHKLTDKEIQELVNKMYVENLKENVRRAMECVKNNI